MRKLENKETTLKTEIYKQIPGENKLIKVQSEQKTTYFELFSDFLKATPQEGWNSKGNFDKLRLRIETLPLFEGKEIGETILIEEKQFDELLESYSKWNWAIFSEELIKLDDYIKNIPKEELKKNLALNE